MIKTGQYQHFKGNFYQVLYIAKHSETEEYLVVYHPDKDIHNIWVRPLVMFDETIIREGKEIKRFTFIK
jgi:hypothetical protein